MEKSYNKTGNFFAVIVVILAVLILAGFVVGSSALFWLLAVLNLVTGPICFVLYLMEIKKGVFAAEKE